MIKQNTPAVLLYRLPPMTLQGQAVHRYLSRQGIRVVTVEPADAGKSLATLLGLRQEAPVTPPPLPGEPVVVIYGLMDPGLDDFLSFLRQNAPVRLKAMVTPFNLHWSFGRLAANLMEDAGAS